MARPVSWANYVPGRDPKHRHACLTLYRRLLVLSKQVPLPSDLPPHPSGPRNPIAHQVRKSFARNHEISSTRLVSAAFRNGYKGLAILKEAADPCSPRHAEVVDFVRARLVEANISRAAHPYTPEERFKMKVRAGRPKRPILIRVPGPPPLPESAKDMDPVEAAILLRSETPMLGYHYERASDPVPREELGGSGIRQVPKLGVCSLYAPFLRYKKPQPRVLSHILNQRAERYSELGKESEIFKEEVVPAAAMEDQWDKMVGDGSLQPQDRGFRQGQNSTIFDKERGETVLVESFAHSARESLHYINEQGAKLKGDFILRTQAYIKIIEDERQLAEKEKLERKNEKMERRLERKAIREGHG